MNRVGRPFKYLTDEIRIESRRIQNKENQRRCRKRRKLLDELNLLYTGPKDFNTQYRNDLVNYTNQFEFNYFFTGTIDLNKIERENLIGLNQQIKRENHEFEMELGFKHERKIGIKSFRKYTERFLQHLSERNLFEHCFVVFEIGKNNKYHTHIMFKSNPGKINFDITSENCWLLGNRITVPINTDEDKEKLLFYCVKEMKPTSTKMSDQNKVDNWFIMGDYKKKMDKTKWELFPKIFETI